jgi:hypothetical protein
MVTILLCDIDRVLRGSRNRVMEMGSGEKFSIEFFAPCNYPRDPSNKPMISLTSASEVVLPSFNDHTPISHDLSNECLTGCLCYADYRKS